MYSKAAKVWMLVKGLQVVFLVALSTYDHKSPFNL
jgi:hypothetical protein